MKRKFKTFFSLLAVGVFVLSLSCNVFAAEPSQEKTYFIINGETVVSYGENYYNPETGEYFIWTTSPSTRSGDIAKSFSFKIRNSVTSSKFTVNSAKVRVDSTAYVTDANNDVVGGFDGTAYKVTLTGIYPRALEFSVNGTESGTISGLVNGGEYSVSISVLDSLPSYPSLHYLQGSGTVTNL